MKSHNYVSRIRRNTAAPPELKNVLDSDPSLQRKRMFFHSFGRNTIDAPFPSYSRFFVSMPFVQLVGDQPVHTLILEIKNKNPVLLKRFYSF